MSGLSNTKQNHWTERILYKLLPVLVLVTRLRLEMFVKDFRTMGFDLYKQANVASIITWSEILLQIMH